MTTASEAAADAADAAEHERLSSEAAADAKKGHPKGLYILFATEMWERFSYYGMRALLVLYLIDYMQWQPGRASGVYKWYTSLVYLTPLIGGFLADRKLGLRLSIVIGGVLMMIGHFLMAFEALPIFYAALAFLIAGNGFFKPNISTLVGKMYRQGDPRRDGAFTIFYMGINLGAGLAPWICGEWLRKHHGFHYGFAAAGVGMALGLVIFLVGQKRILADVKEAGNDLRIERKDDAKTKGAAHDEADEKRAGHGGFSGALSRAFPWLMFAVAIGVPALYVVSIVRGTAAWTDAIMPVAFACIAGWMGRSLLTIRGASRDKSTVIFALFVFIVLFWMAFEQAGNALNIWAEINTDRHLTPTYEYSAEIWQSVNAFLIVSLAPLFALMWKFFIRKGIEISTPAKMFGGLVFVALSFAAMVVGAMTENRVTSTVALEALPSSVKDLSALDAGRMSFDASKHELSVRGVLPPFAVIEALDLTLDKPDHDAIVALEKNAANASTKAPVHVAAPARMNDASYAWPFDAKESDDFGVTKQGADLVATKPLTERAKAKLVASLADPTWRTTLDDLAKKSEAARVSGIWLFLSYLLATLGELCLSPVGLSMVTKLAPARFASLFMGVWLLSSSVAQYVGGSIGESWGKITPSTYFWIFVWSSIVGAIVLFVLVRPLRKLMHEVT
jgi:POT family proton-dependent oligopeptide transporter